MCWSSGTVSNLTRRASCPSRWLNLVCKIPISLLSLSETNTIGYYCALAYEVQTAYRQAIDCFGAIVAALDGAQRYERFGQVTLPAVVARANSAGCHAELGLFPEGKTLGEEGLRIAEAAA